MFYNIIFLLSNINCRTTIIGTSFCKENKPSSVKTSSVAQCKLVKETLGGIFLVEDSITEGICRFSYNESYKETRLIPNTPSNIELCSSQITCLKNCNTYPFTNYLYTECLTIDDIPLPSGPPLSPPRPLSPFIEPFPLPPLPPPLSPVVIIPPSLPPLPSTPIPQATGFCNQENFIFNENLIRVYSQPAKNLLIGLITDERGTNELIVEDEDAFTFTYRQVVEDYVLNIVEARNGLDYVENFYTDTCCGICETQFQDCDSFTISVTNNTLQCTFFRINNQQSFASLEYDNTLDYKAHYSLMKFDHRINPPFPPSPFPPPGPSLIEQNIFLYIITTPGVLIPTLLGIISILVVFLYIFRECNVERAAAVSSVFNTFLGRSKPEVIVT